MKSHLGWGIFSSCERFVSFTKKCLMFPWGKLWLHSYGKSCNPSFSSFEINDVAPSSSF